MEKYQKFCQSCGIPLKSGESSGTEGDGSKSLLYCQLCYQNGKFTQPNLTLEDMKQILDDTVGKQGLKGRFLAWVGKMQLPSLRRWQS